MGEVLFFHGDPLFEKAMMHLFAISMQYTLRLQLGGTGGKYLNIISILHQCVETLGTFHNDNRLLWNTFLSCDSTTAAVILTVN